MKMPPLISHYRHSKCLCVPERTIIFSWIYLITVLYFAFFFFLSLRHSSPSIFLLASTLHVGWFQKEALCLALSPCWHPARMRTWLPAFHKAKSYKFRWSLSLWDDISTGTKPSQFWTPQEQSKVCSGRCWSGASCSHWTRVEHRHSCVSEAFFKILITHFYSVVHSNKDNLRRGSEVQHKDIQKK